MAIGLSVTVLLINFEDISEARLVDVDADKDGIIDRFDNCPKIKNENQDDFDNDTLGNPCDVDDDNDKIVDEMDAFDDNSEEWSDFDFDGIGANQDPDDDNDTIVDQNDQTPILATEKLAVKYLEKISYCTVMENGTSKLLCEKQLFTDIVKQEKNNVDVLELSGSLERLGVVADCHFISHSIGYSAFEEKPDILTNFIDMEKPLCRGGYYHGLLESYFENLKENNEPFPTSYNVVCDEFIGTSVYRGCIHGLGHGLVSYFEDDLKSATNACHKMSLYQDLFCISGVMMQHTDNQLTKNGFTQKNISNMCSKQELDELDYWNCSGNIGVTLAFHTNHNFDESSKFCNFIDDEDGKKFCLAAVQKEIVKALDSKTTDLTEEDTDKFQPKWIKPGDKKWIVDFHSSAIISNFDYVEDIKKMVFSFDKVDTIRIYVWNELLPEEPVVMINGEDADWDVKYDAYENYTMIKISPTSLGTVEIISSPK